VTSLISCPVSSSASCSALSLCAPSYLLGCSSPKHYFNNSIKLHIILPQNATSFEDDMLSSTFFYTTSKAPSAVTSRPSTLLSPLLLQTPSSNDCSHSGRFEETPNTHNFSGSENLQPSTTPWAMALYDEGKIQAQIDSHIVKLQCPNSCTWVDTGARAPSILSISQDKKYFTSFTNHITSKKCQQSSVYTNTLSVSPAI
jgi:hypothetical protein